jgi:hypothetical protein
MRIYAYTLIVLNVDKGSVIEFYEMAVFTVSLQLRGGHKERIN